MIRDPFRVEEMIPEITRTVLSRRGDE